MESQAQDAGWWATALWPLAAAFVGFVCIWPLSVWRKDASLVDLVWAPGFAVQVGIAVSLAGEVDARGLLIIALICAWSARLSYVLIRRRLHEGVEDARYTAIRTSWGPSFWWKSLFIVFVLQSFLQWLISLGPIAGVVLTDGPLGILSRAGTCIALVGVVLEAKADHELDKFKAEAGAGGLLTTGLRAYVRHPNYTGEIIFWVGMALIAVEGGALLGLISPVLIIFFLTKVSGAPMLDERLAATRPEYQAYKERVPAFLPRLRREQIPQ